MHLSAPADELEAPAPQIFATTHWSVVMAAGEIGSEISRDALETLCSAYWSPIYVFVRRRGYGPDDAQDLTQEFFAQIIAKQRLRLADRNKGRFRSFLVAMLHRFLAREWGRAHRQKRGGHCKIISLDQRMAEERRTLEPIDGDTPEKQFDRQWALTVLKRSMNALENECAGSGKGDLFREVQPLLSGERDGASYPQISVRLSMTEPAVRVAVHRLRHRYGELLREEIAQTVDFADEVEEELRFLLRALTE